MSKTNIPHTKLIEFSSISTLHRGVILVSYCKTNEIALQKAKSEILNSSKKSLDEYIFVVK